MLLIVGSILWFSVATLVNSQDNCECKDYFYCTGNYTSSPTCMGEFEVCCSIDASSPSTERAQPLPVATTETPVTNTVNIGAAPSLCGVRGKLPPRVQPMTSGSGPSNVASKDTPTPEDLGSIVDFKVFDDLGGDTSTIFGEFPWMVAVMKVNPGGGQEFLCGGSIIYPQIILTTAHSVRNYSPSDLVVKAGVWSGADPTETAMHQNRALTDIFLHPGFDMKKVENDIAVLVLEEPLTFTSNVAPICLPSEDLPIDTNKCVATGWGGAANFGNQMNSVLKKVDLPLVNYDTCENRLRQVEKLGSNFTLHNSFICAGGDKVDTCSGDGGGPLMCSTYRDPNRYVQMGVTSWGVGCGQGPPGVYASVQAAAGFIENAHTGVLITQGLKKSEGTRN